MKRTKHILTLLFTLFIIGTASAQNPKWFKKAHKMQLTVYAYDEKDNMREGQGFYLDNKGTAQAEYDLLKGAVRATVIDADGKQFEVSHIEGASSLYNVVKLGTTSQKSNTVEPLQGKLAAGQLVYVLPLCSNKNGVCTEDTIRQVQEFGDGNYPYYSLGKSYDARMAGCPVLSAEGQLLGHLQMSAKGANEPAYVEGIGLANSLAITAMDVNNSDLKVISIAKALPNDDQQAATYLYLLNKQDTKAYQQAVEEYIRKFPNNSNGYTQLAELQVAEKLYKQAEETYAKALTMKTGHDDEIHHSFAKQLYQTALQEKTPAEGWTMEHALQEAEAANAANPQPLYTALEGLCKYAQKDYQGACEKFLDVTKTNMRAPEYFLYASQCKQMQNASNDEILALLDSAINCYTKPYPTEAAQYIYLRSQTYSKMERYRDAVSDLNEYEHLLAGNVNANFYYEREQNEMKCKMYPQALSDIDKCTTTNPNEPLFFAEKAAICYRFEQTDEAIKACKEAIRLDDKFADAYRILGICQRDKGQTAEAKKNLQKAIELGDTLSESILQKMQ